MTIEVRVPDIGDFDTVEIIEVFVQAGSSVQENEALLLLESDKATMEVPSPAAGTIESLQVAVGDKVSQGDLVALLTESVAAAEAAPAVHAEAAPIPAAEHAPRSESATEKPPASTPVAAVSTARPALAQLEVPAAAGPGPLPYASPSVRRLARELGVDLAQLTGSGRKGRIRDEDVRQFVKAAMSGAQPVAASSNGLPTMPEVDFAKFGPTETRPLSRIRKLSARNLHRNWVIVPHVTQFETADITELDAFRRSESQRGGVKFTLLPFFMKAAAVALKKFPEFNSSLDASGENLVYKQYTHIGFAAETEQGLVVPVVRDVDRKTVTDLAEEASALAAKAREGKLSPAEMQGGCFSISSLGGIGGSHFTPIVNAPEVAILGVSRAAQQPVWDGQSFQPRLMLPLSLSYDHRVIDGAAAARFVVTYAELLTDPRRLLL